MHTLIPLLALLSILPTALALHQSEVGVIDWHKPLIGVPLTHSLSTAPVFHRVSTGAGRTKSVVVSATASGVLAALDPVDGSLGVFSLFYLWVRCLFYFWV